MIEVGIQSIIQHIGIEPNYFCFKNLNAIEFDRYNVNDYLIVHHGVLQKPKFQHINKILDSFKGEVLIIGNEKLLQYKFPHILYPNDSKTQTVEKIQNFFASIKNTDKEYDKEIISAREIDILKEVALGYSNKEIAERLFISINTVITHRKNLTEKLGIKTISGLTVYALMNNLINPEDVTF